MKEFKLGLSILRPLTTCSFPVVNPISLENSADSLPEAIIFYDYFGTFSRLLCFLHTIEDLRWSPKKSQWPIHRSSIFQRKLQEKRLLLAD